MLADGNNYDLDNIIVLTNITKMAITALMTVIVTMKKNFC